MQQEITIGELAERSGVATSALRFYEERGLIRSLRTAAGHRRYSRDVLRRVAIIKVAQRAGIPLAAIHEALQALPQEQAPTAKDWQRMSSQWKQELDARIARLTKLRNQLGKCIGCGCLSLKACPLRNPQDKLSRQGSGARLLDPD